MNSSGTVITFLIVVFCLAGIVILKKDSIPSSLRRFIAITTLILIIAAFIMLLAVFWTMGNP